MFMNSKIFNFLLLAFISFNSSFLVFCDFPQPGQLGFQQPATEVMNGMITFHNLLMSIIVFIAIFVFYLLSYTILFFSNRTVKVDTKELVAISYYFEWMASFSDLTEKWFTQPNGIRDRLNIVCCPKIYTVQRPISELKRRFSHNSPLEIIWTIIPAFILLIIAVPSFTLLYSLEDFQDPEMTVTVVGHQWYWSYEYSDFFSSTDKVWEYNSFLVPYEESGLYLLGCNLGLIVPVRTNIRLLVTSADVLHSWAVPSFGIKIDACPGRLTQGSLYLYRQGAFVGQCSEICGINHGFMPIMVIALRPHVAHMVIMEGLNGEYEDRC